jgi:alkylation response protein AidB-like acyl-CoA dehydrogenase
MIDHGLIAMAKWYAGDAGVKCAEMALQLHGGYGYLDEYKVERLYRDAKIVDIWEGTKEIEKLVVARAVLQQ